MINFSKISNQSVLGKLLRLFLFIIPDNATVYILQGKLKGKKWIKGSGVNGYWLGSYEKEKVKIFEENLKEGDIVFDVGANVGFYSLLAAEIVGSFGSVFSFEPLLQNFNYLKGNIELNKIKNINIFNIAVSSESGLAFFNTNNNRSQGQISKSGKIKVETVKLDEWVDGKKLPLPSVMKIDVEGAEMQVLEGAKSLILQSHPMIFLATHGKDIHEKCCDFLISLGYKLEPIGAENIDETDEILARF